MKLLKSLVLLLTLVVFCSCSNDDDNGRDISANIAGSWQATDVNVNGDVSTIYEGNELSTTVTGIPQNLNYSLTFVEDTGMVTSTGDFDVVLNGSFLGQSYSETIENIDPVGGMGNYIVAGSSLSIMVNGESATATIIELTEEILTLALETKETYDLDGQQFTANLESEITFNRL